MNAKQWMLAASLSLVAWGAQALQITSFSPQGEVARVRQVVAKFDSAAVNFGDPKAPAPLSLSCSDASATQAPWQALPVAQQEPCEGPSTAPR